MKFNTAMVLIVLTGIVGTGATTMASNWARIERDNNAFAKDCNDRGGQAFFGWNARQCIGARMQAGQRQGGTHG